MRSLLPFVLGTLLATPALADTDHAFLRETLDGELVDTADRVVSVDKALDAPFVLLYVGASWCPACVRHTPGMVKFVRRMPHKDLVDPVFLSRDEDQRRRTAYRIRHRLTWPTATLAGPIKGTLGERYAFERIPHLILLDENDEVLLDSMTLTEDASERIPTFLERMAQLLAERASQGA